MANSIGWGQGAVNNSIGWGQGSENNSDGWGSVHAGSWSPETSLGSGGTSLDTDAQAFITAAAITDSTQQSAVNQLVLDLKTANIWTKMKAVYPFVGGTATSHKWNLVNPVDSDAAFRLTFSGGWTHSATGALPNGTNGYADTFVNPLTHLDDNSYSMGVYLNSDLTAVRYHFGASGSTGSQTFILRSSNSTTKQAYIEQSAYPLNKTITAAQQKGFWGISLRASNDRAMICQDGSFVYVTTNSQNTNVDLNIFIGARNSLGSALNFDTMSHAFEYISEGLNDTELTNLKTAVDTFQTTLSRNV